MVQLLTFKFFQLAQVSRRELLVSQNSKAKPKQRRQKWRAASRHANIMTKFAKYHSHAHQLRLSVSQSYAVKRQIMSHAIFVLFPIPFRIFSKSNDFHSMVNVGNPVAFMKQDKKKMLWRRLIFLIFPLLIPCSKNVYNV